MRQNISLEIVERLSFTYFTLSILEYLGPFEIVVFFNLQQIRKHARI